MATIRINSALHSHLWLASQIAKSLDSKFVVGKFRFGLDPILGLIPGVGDVISLILSLYIVWIGIQIRLPADKIAQMMGNVAYDFFLGVIPIIGDIADFTFKANTKNLEILKKYAPDIVEGEVV